MLKDSWSEVCNKAPNFLEIPGQIKPTKRELFFLNNTLHAIKQRYIFTFGGSSNVEKTPGNNHELIMMLDTFKKDQKWNWIYALPKSVG
jgi:hypothetical protein